MYLCRVTIGKKQNQAYLRTKVANTEALTYEVFIVLLLGSDLVRDSVCVKSQAPTQGLHCLQD